MIILLFSWQGDGTRIDRLKVRNGNTVTGVGVCVFYM